MEGVGAGSVFDGCCIAPAWIHTKGDDCLGWRMTCCEMRSHAGYNSGHPGKLFLRGCLSVWGEAG